MSQAVCAPSTGKPFVAPHRAQENIGRRAMLTGLALVPAALTAPLAASTIPEWPDPVALSRQIDVLFWAQRDVWLSIRSDWCAADSAGYLTDDENDAFCARLDVAEYSMMTCRILTLPALYAKMEAVREEPENRLRDKDDPTTMFDALMWDVERLIAKGYRA